MISSLIQQITLCSFKVDLIPIKCVKLSIQNKEDIYYCRRITVQKENLADKNRRWHVHKWTIIITKNRKWMRKQDKTRKTDGQKTCILAYKVAIEYPSFVCQHTELAFISFLRKKLPPVTMSKLVYCEENSVTTNRLYSWKTFIQKTKTWPQNLSKIHFHEKFT